MNSFFKVAVVAVLSQAAFACEAYAGSAASPVAVNVSVEELSEASELISAATAAGDDSEAARLLSGLFSGGLRVEKSAPVYSDKCCCPCAGTVQPPAAAPAAPAAVAPAAPAVTAEEALAAAAAAAAEKEKEEAEKEKRKRKNRSGSTGG